MANEEREIKKLRQEAAKYRTQHAPFKEAFAGLDPEATEWMLHTVKMVSQDPAEAGKRFATLAYGNLGDVEFKQWINDVVYDGEGNDLAIEEETGDNKEMTGQDSNNPQPGEFVDMTDWASNLENKLMGAIASLEKRNEEREQKAIRQQTFNTISQKISDLGYEPDSWQGKMVVQIASQETDQNLPIEQRLDAASAIAQQRINPATMEQKNVTIGTAEVSAEPATEVPATGGDVGGGGIPDINGEEPISFGDANQALNDLLKSQVGQ